MATNNDRVLVAKDSELWVDGIDTRPMATQITVGPQLVERSNTRSSSDVAQTQPVMAQGNLEMSAFSEATEDFNFLRAQWTAAASGEYLAPIAWSAGAGGMLVGNHAGATMISPKTSPVASAAAEELVSHSFGGSWHRREVFGELRSTQTASGRHPVDSPMTSDYATQAINTVGPDIYTDSVNVGSVGIPVAAFAVAKSITGATGSPPQASFTITDTAWLSGQLDAANSKNLTIGHTVDGNLVSLTIPQDRPNYYTHETVATVYEDIERLVWTDGFRIERVGTGNPVVWRGNRYGADEDIVFDSNNEIPVGSPFVGTFNGTGHSTKFRIVKATGSGGSRVFTPISDFYECDEHDVPAVAVGIDEAGVEQLALQFQVPQEATPYNFSIAYSICYIIDGS